MQLTQLHNYTQHHKAGGAGAGGGVGGALGDAAPHGQCALSLCARGRGRRVCVYVRAHMRTQRALHSRWKGGEEPPVQGAVAPARPATRRGRAHTHTRTDALHARTQPLTRTPS